MFIIIIWIYLCNNKQKQLKPFFLFLINNIPIFFKRHIFNIKYTHKVDNHRWHRLSINVTIRWLWIRFPLG